MASKRKSKYYVVWVGQNPGIYNNWTDCQLQIKAYPGAKYKSFKTLEEAKAAYGGDYEAVVSRSTKKSKPDFHHIKSLPIEKNSISVDAACSGNPGLMEYRGVITTTGEEIFKKGPYKRGTNNIGEFLALVHGLALLKKQNDDRTKIYTDSRTALAWVRHKRVKTVLKPDKDNAVLFIMIERAIKWLKTNSYNNEIIKWDTKNWGEIPADFGRK
jgi:ribonuclease HI